MVKLTIKDIILDTLIFLGIIVTFVWLILKQLGFIHTHWFIAIIPFAASGIAISAFIYHVVGFIHELKPLPQQVLLLTKRVDRIDNRADQLEQGIKQKFAHVDKDLEFLKKIATH